MSNIEKPGSRIRAKLRLSKKRNRDYDSLSIKCFLLKQLPSIKKRLALGKKQYQALFSLKLEPDMKLIITLEKYAIIRYQLCLWQ